MNILSNIKHSKGADTSSQLKNKQTNTVESLFNLKYGRLHYIIIPFWLSFWPLGMESWIIKHENLKDKH